MTLSRSLITVVIAAALLTATSNVAVAQPNDAPSRIQIGGSGGAFVILPTFGARVTVPIRSPFAVEVTGEYLPVMLDDHCCSKWLLFQGQMRHQLKRGRTWRMHATYGATLFTSYERHRERREPRPDGSVLVFPEYRRLHVRRPLGVHGGFGAERALSDHVAARWDLQVIVPATQSAARLSTIPIPKFTFSIAWQPAARR